MLPSNMSDDETLGRDGSNQEDFGPFIGTRNMSFHLTEGFCGASSWLYQFTTPNKISTSHKSIHAVFSMIMTLAQELRYSKHYTPLSSRLELKHLSLTKKQRSLFSLFGFWGQMFLGKRVDCFSKIKD